ncbi:MAG: LysR family transcriptional regulator [Bacillota bacterium]|nr:LysR family transcriptional regulator [Bacillota bacterium]
MDLKQLRYFLQICEDKSFSNAAKSLFITQQALSKSIKNMEEELQLPLLVRSNNGLELTEYGEYLYKHSIPIIQEYDILMQNLNKMSISNHESIKIGFSNGVLNALSTEFIADFSKNHRDIELDISEHTDLECEQLILDNKLDMVFLIGPIDKSKFNSITIKKENMCALVNDDNPLSRKNTLDFVDLKDENIVILNHKFRTYYNFVSRCEKAGFTPNITYPVGGILTVHRFSRSNDCVGISAYFVVDEIGSSNTKVLPFNDETFVWEICLVTNKDLCMTNNEKKFINYTLNYHNINKKSLGNY